MNKVIKTFKTILKNPKYQLLLILEGIVIGLVSGIISSFYRYLLTNSENILYSVLDIIRGNISLIILWFIILVILGYITGYLMKWESLASGSGIPQVSGEIKGYLNPKWWKVLIAKIVGGTISTLAGLSLGREGPSIQLGGMASKGLSKNLKRSKTEEQRFILAGASAGLAATFNAPLAGLMFTLEEIHHNFDKTLILVALIAVILGDFVSKLIFGQGTIFNFTPIQLPLKYFWLLIILGILIGILGYVYNFTMIKANDFWSKIEFLPVEFRITLIFVITGIVSLYVPEILAGGHSMMEILRVAMPTFGILLFLLFGKFIFSVLCFSSGAPGGIFFPLLVLGAYIGACFGSIVIPIFGLDSMLIYNFIIISMAALFSSTVRAPITGVVLISEMTGSINSLITLIIVSIIAYVIPHVLGNKPIYESLLDRIVMKNTDYQLNEQPGHILSNFNIPRSSNIIDLEIKDVPFPKTSLIVSIQRESSYFIPDENTILKSGDELYFLMSSNFYNRDKKMIEFLIYKKKM